MDRKEYEERYEMIEKGAERGAISLKAALAAVALTTLEFAANSDACEIKQEIDRRLDCWERPPSTMSTDADRAKVRDAYLDHTRGVIERSEARREQAARKKIERDPLG